MARTTSKFGMVCNFARAGLGATTGARAFLPRTPSSPCAILAPWASGCRAACRILCVWTFSWKTAVRGREGFPRAKSVAIGTARHGTRAPFLPLLPSPVHAVLVATTRAVLMSLCLFHQRCVARVSAHAGALGDQALPFSITHAATRSLSASAPLCPSAQLAILNPSARGTLTAAGRLQVKRATCSTIRRPLSDFSSARRYTLAAFRAARRPCGPIGDCTIGCRWARIRVARICPVKIIGTRSAAVLRVCCNLTRAKLLTAATRGIAETPSAPIAERTIDWCGRRACTCLLERSDASFSYSNRSCADQACPVSLVINLIPAAKPHAPT